MTKLDKNDLNECTLKSIASLLLEFRMIVKNLMKEGQHPSIDNYSALIYTIDSLIQHQQRTLDLIRDKEMLDEYMKLKNIQETPTQKEE